MFDSGRILPVMAFFWASDRWGMWRVFSGLIWTLSPSSGADRPSTRLSPVVSSVSLLEDFLTWSSSVERRLMLEFDPWDKDSDCTWRTFPRSWFSRACSFCQWMRIKWKQNNYPELPNTIIMRLSLPNSTCERIHHIFKFVLIQLFLRDITQ